MLGVSNAKHASPIEIGKKSLVFIDDASSIKPDTEKHVKEFDADIFILTMVLEYIKSPAEVLKTVVRLAGKDFKGAVLVFTLGPNFFDCGASDCRRSDKNGAIEYERSVTFGLAKKMHSQATIRNDLGWEAIFRDSGCQLVSTAPLFLPHGFQEAFIRVNAARNDPLLRRFVEGVALDGRLDFGSSFGRAWLLLPTVHGDKLTSLDIQTHITETPEPSRTSMHSILQPVSRALLCEVRFPAGSVIIHPSALGGDVFVMVHGRAAIIDMDGALQATLQEGEIVGEIETWEGNLISCRSCFSVVAVNDCTVVRVPRVDFMSIIESELKAVPVQIAPQLFWKLRNSLVKNSWSYFHKGAHGRPAMTEAARIMQLASLESEDMTRDTSGLVILIGAPESSRDNLKALRNARAVSYVSSSDTRTDLQVLARRSLLGKFIVEYTTVPAYDQNRVIEDWENRSKSGGHVKFGFGVQLRGSCDRETLERALKASIDALRDFGKMKTLYLAVDDCHFMHRICFSQSFYDKEIGRAQACDNPEDPFYRAPKYVARYIDAVTSFILTATKGGKDVHLSGLQPG